MKVILGLLAIFGLFFIAISLTILPTFLLIFRVYCLESYKYLKDRHKKKLEKISLKQLNNHIVNNNWEYDFAKDNPFYTFPIFSHCTLIFYIFKDIFGLILSLFVFINNKTMIFTYIWRFIKWIFSYICKFIQIIFYPFVWLKNEFILLANYISNIKFI